MYPADYVTKKEELRKDEFPRGEPGMRLNGEDRKRQKKDETFFCKNVPPEFVGSNLNNEYSQ